MVPAKRMIVFNDCHGMYNPDSGEVPCHYRELLCDHATALVPTREFHA